MDKVIDLKTVFLDDLATQFRKEFEKNIAEKLAVPPEVAKILAHSYIIAVRQGITIEEAFSKVYEEEEEDRRKIYEPEGFYQPPSGGSAVGGCDSR